MSKPQTIKASGPDYAIYQLTKINIGLIMRRKQFLIVGNPIIVEGCCSPVRVTDECGILIEEVRWIPVKKFPYIRQDVGFNYTQKVYSRRGRNLKPDESKKARYSQSRK